MNVLALTIYLSICLAGIFIVCFALERRSSRRSSPERDSLLPMDPEGPPAHPTATAGEPVPNPNTPVCPSPPCRLP